MSRIPVDARSALEALSQQLERRDFGGYDPFDALSSPVLRSVARTRLARGGIIQLLKRSPLNARPLLGVPRLAHTKGVALCAAAYARMAALEPEQRWRGLAHELAGRLLPRAIPSGDGIGWGYDFDVQTRWAYYRRGEPNAIVTVFTAHALLDVAEVTGDEALADTARRALGYVRSRLLRERDGEVFFAYFETSEVPIHNASVLLAGLLARCGTPDDVVLARRAADYTRARQAADGSWAYGEGPRLEWVDGYHTAYVLDGLAQVHAAANDPAIATAVRRGLDLYMSRLFDPDGAPRATLESRWPVDVHAASSAIATFSRLGDLDPRVPAIADRTLAWTLSNLRRRDGRFAFQAHPRYVNRSAYFRWNDAHMLLALACHIDVTS